jgi:hypothetical protein
MTISSEDKGDAALDSLEGTLASLPALLERRRKELDSREKELEDAIEAFHLEQKDFCGRIAGKANDVLRLNVGGRCIDVLRRTLTSVPGSMLASKFSGRWDESAEKDRDDNFFIDQPIELFRPLINFLRDKAQGCAIPPLRSPGPQQFTSNIQYEQFQRLVEYYGLTQCVFPVGIQVHEKTPVFLSNQRVVRGRRDFY